MQTSTRPTASPQAAAFPGPHVEVDALDVEGLLALLADARERTYRLLAPLDDEAYRTSHHPVMGPVAWDVGHIGQQEDLWLVQRLGGRPETDPGSNDLYDAYKHPRATRATLPLLSKSAVRAYHEKVRSAAVAVLRTGPGDLGDPLWQGLFVAKMVLLHEHQHDETILQHAAAMPPGRYAPADRVDVAPQAHGTPEGFAHVPGGRVPLGVAPRTAWTYDNEWPEHTVDVASFWLQRTPVTNGQFLRFVEDGGYEDPRHWDPEGHRTVVQEGGGTAPMYWSKRDGQWRLRRFDREVPLPLQHPVCNVSWYEADAFARWAGLRLPTEAEWETAATIDPATGMKRRYPWGDTFPTRGHANLDQRRYGTDPVGSHPLGASPLGVHQLVGDVWEWTTTAFAAYPGFEAFPYDEYSKIFFGQGLRVLRGGSWATRPWLRLGTFRNWDLPQRRQLFAGLRLAASSAPVDAPLFSPMDDRTWSRAP